VLREHDGDRIGPVRPDISSLIPGCRGALLIRHSERFGGDIADPTDGLTPHGKVMARELGSRLRGRGPLRFFASPIPRCLDTARLIAEGAECDQKVMSSNQLGDPGPFVIDGREVDRNLAVLGLKGFAVSWLSGGISPKVMRPCPEGCSLLLNWVSGNLASTNEGVDVYISHDLFLTPALVRYVGYDLGSSGLLGFLDGFCLVKDGRTIHLTYQDEHRVLEGPF
jgi:hypothetical protein